MKKSTPSNSKSISPRPPTHDQIAALAHAIWVDRGSPSGSDLDIWLEAERQLKGDAPPRHRVAADDIPADPANPDVDRDPAATSETKRELDRLVQTRPQQRSPTSL